MRIRVLPPVLAIAALLLLSACSAHVAATNAGGDSGPTVIPSGQAAPASTPAELDLTSPTAWKAFCRLTEEQINSALAPYNFHSIVPQNGSVNPGENECLYSDSADNVKGVGITIWKYASGTTFGTDGATDLQWSAESPAQAPTSACTAYGPGAQCQSVTGGQMVISAGGTDGMAFPVGDYFYTFIIYGIANSAQLQGPAHTLAAELLALGPVVP